MIRMRCAMPSNAAAFSATSRRERRLEREDLDLVLRPLRAERLAVEERAFAARAPSTPRPSRSRRRRRTRRRAIVSPSATAIESEKNGMPRFALSEPSIGSMTTRHAPAAELADLLGDDRRVEPVEAREDHALGGGVDRRRVVAALALRRARARARRASAARRARRARPPTAPRQSASQSVKRVEEQAARELREEVRRLLRQHLAAARALEHRVDRRRPHEQRRLGVAAVDGRLGLLAARRVRDAFRARGARRARRRGRRPRRAR